MENKDKVKLLEKKLLSESDMTDEKYKQMLIDFCKDLDKRPCVDGTEAIHKIVKRLNLNRNSPFS